MDGMAGIKTLQSAVVFFNGYENCRKVITFPLAPSAIGNRAAPNPTSPRAPI